MRARVYDFDPAYYIPDDEITEETICEICDPSFNPLCAEDRQATLRHEIIHAFLAESGLWGSSEPAKAWAMNEEMIDWIALQFPKILKAFKEAKAIV